VDGESGGWLFWEEAEAGGGRRILADPLQLYKSSRHLFHVQHLRVATVQTHSLYNFFYHPIPSPSILRVFKSSSRYHSSYTMTRVYVVVSIYRQNLVDNDDP